jgi:hypothetical protein
MSPASKKMSGKLLAKMRRGVQAVTYGNPLYQRILAATDGVPDRLFFTLPDIWPGDANAGRTLISDQGALFERPLPARPAGALRNLRAVGTDAARKMAIQLIDQWLQRYDHWHDVEWAPDIMGERIGAWIGAYEFFAPAASPEFLKRLSGSLNRQYRHLARAVPANLNGIGGLRTIKGLVLSALNFDGSDKSLSVACELLNRQLMTEILPDGGVKSRSPSVQLHMIRHLIDLRAIFMAAGIEVPLTLSSSIGTMIPALKLFRHGDGGLALFHGGAEESSLLIDAIITQSGAKGRVARRLVETGFDRITAGRSLLIADCATPAARGHDKTAHAGLLSFEFGQGRERLIVNCGAIENAIGEWRTACAATAAHSTLTINDTNSCEVLADGGVTSTATVTVGRFEQNGMHGLELAHDAYLAKFGVQYQRRLSLSADGDTLVGHDIMNGPPGRNFTLRWHLHPSLQASLTHSGQAALLRTPSGMGWRLSTESSDLSLEPSIYCGSGSARRSLQLRVSGFTDTPTTEIKWSLVREKK